MHFIKLILTFLLTLNSQLCSDQDFLDKNNDENEDEDVDLAKPDYIFKSGPNGRDVYNVEMKNSTELRKTNLKDISSQLSDLNSRLISKLERNCQDGID